MKKLLFILLTLLCCKVYAQPDNQDHAYTGHGRYLVPGTLSINRGSDAIGDIYYRNLDGTLNRLGIGTAGQVLTVSAGLPAWLTGGGGGSGTVTSVSSGNLASLYTVVVNNSTTTPTFVFFKINAPPHTFYGNTTGGSTTPSFQQVDTSDIFQFYRARTLMSGVAPIAYNPVTGVISTSMNTARLIGRTTAATGAMQEIKIGTGLVFSNDTLKATGGGGGSGDIKKDGSVNFEKSEKWTVGNIYTTTVDSSFITVSGGGYTSTIFPSSVSSRGGDTRGLVSGDGFVQLESSISGSQVTQLKTADVTIAAADVYTLYATPYPVIPPGGVGFTTVISDVLAVWSVGTTYYDGIQSLYFFTSGVDGAAPAYTPQYKIDCSAVSVSPYSQRGVAQQTIFGNKNNTLDNKRVYVSTDAVNTQGNAILTLHIVYYLIRIF